VDSEPAPNSPDLLTTRQVAAAAGLDASTVRGLLLAGEGPAGVRTARGWRFEVPEVLAWLARRQAEKPVRQLVLPADHAQPVRLVFPIAGQLTSPGALPTGELLQLLAAREHAARRGRLAEFFDALRRIPEAAA
jgi:hypothetical protein